MVVGKNGLIDCSKPQTPDPRGWMVGVDVTPLGPVKLLLWSLSAPMPASHGHSLRLTSWTWPGAVDRGDLALEMKPRERLWLLGQLSLRLCAVAFRLRWMKSAARSTSQPLVFLNSVEYFTSTRVGGRINMSQNQSPPSDPPAWFVYSRLLWIKHCCGVLEIIFSLCISPALSALRILPSYPWRSF